MRRLLPLLCAPLSLAAPALAYAQADGHVLFTQNCSACHQVTGKGVPGAFPALAGDAYVKGAKPPVIKTLLNGRGGMPRFGDQLTNVQIAAAITYIRGAWGNGASPVAPKEVAALRVGPEPGGVKESVQAH